MDSSSTVLQILIKAKDEASSAINGISHSVEGLGEKTKVFMGGAMREAGIAAAIGIGAVTIAAKQSVDAFNESEVIAAQLEAVLKSTGGAAGITSKAALDLSKSLEKVTSFSDETVLSTENMLLTFTAIGKDVFPQVTERALDMATAMNGGATPSMEQTRTTAILLGKALQDPDAGLGALHRVGVNVTELKKQFTAAMPIQEKQALIIKEIGNEFGGSARKHLETYKGAMEHLHETIDDVQESFGKFIVQAITPLTRAIADFVGSVDWDAVMGKITTAFTAAEKAIVRFTKPLVDFYNSHAKLINGWLKDFAIAMGIIITGLALFGAALAIINAPLFAIAVAVGAIVAVFKIFEPQIKALGTALTPVFKMIGDSVMDLWKTISTQLFPALQKLWTEAAPILIPLLKALAVVFGVVLFAAIMIIIQAIKAVVEVFVFFVKMWTLNIEIMKAVGKFFTDTLPKTFSDMGKAIGNALNDFIGGAMNIWNGFFRFMKGMVDGIVSYFSNFPRNFGITLGEVARLFLTFVAVTVPNFIMGIVNWFAKLPTEISKSVSQMWGEVVRWFNATSTHATTSASNTFNGVVNWFSRLPSAVGSWIAQMWNYSVAGFNHFLNSALGWANNTINQIVNYFAGLPAKLGKSIKDAFSSAGSMASSFAGGFTFGFGKREKGGPVSGQTPYIVGEKGPELFVPSGDGNIVPNHALGGGGATTNIYGNINLGSADAVKQFFGTIGRNQELARKGMTTVGL